MAKLKDFFQTQEDTSQTNEDTSQTDVTETSQEEKDHNTLLEDTTSKANTSEEKEEYAEKDKYGNPIYSDPVIDSIKRCLNTSKEAIKRTIKYYQIGYKLVFYQGMKANTYGFVELNSDKKTHKVRIYNSTLGRIFKADPNTKDFFKDKIL